MSQKSVTKRVRITKSGIIVRRSMALGHSRTNKRQTQINRKKRNRSLSLHSYDITKYF